MTLPINSMRNYFWEVVGMLVEFFSSVVFTALATVVGSLWIDKLYRTSTELTFPKKISERSKFRRSILFYTLVPLNWFVLSSTNAPENFFMLAAIFLLALMTVTDFEQYMLFDAMTLSLALIGAIRVWQMGLNVQDCVAASAIGGGIFLLLAVLSKGALGGGDVKLIAALGLWLGCEKILSVVLIGTVSAGIVALLLILAKKKDRKSYFAYGPYFALAAIYILLSG